LMSRVLADATAGGLHGTRGEEPSSDRAEPSVDQRIVTANDRSVADRRAVAGVCDELREVAVARMESLENWTLSRSVSR
jgi:hypothetical protein